MVGGAVCRRFQCVRRTLPRMQEELLAGLFHFTIPRFKALMMPMRGKHCRPAERRDQDQGFPCRLPFRRRVLGLRKICNVIAGVLERDELATARQRYRIRNFMRTYRKATVSYKRESAQKRGIPFSLECGLISGRRVRVIRGC